MKLLWLIDNLDYIAGNCFQHQIQRTLEREFDITYASLNEIIASQIDKKYDKIFCSIKARNVFKYVREIQCFLNGNEVIIYDQDPWEGFVDDGICTGHYHQSNAHLNVKSFFVTSKWWSDYVHEQVGVPTTFVKMGILPEYCQWKPWKERKTHLAFKGKMHAHRKVFFDELKLRNIDVTIDTSSSNYRDFLNYLSNCGIYVHSEERTFIVNGEKLDYNGIWIKEIEAASQGCFVLRNYEDEAKAYDVDEISTIIRFKTLDDIEGFLDIVATMTEKRLDRITKEAVEKIRLDDNWTNSLAKSIKEI